MSKETITAAAKALAAAVAETSNSLRIQLEKLPADEDRIMWAAAYACGAAEADSDVTLALDYDTEWLQDAYDAGRLDHPHFEQSRSRAGG